LREATLFEIEQVRELRHEWRNDKKRRLLEREVFNAGSSYYLLRQYKPIENHFMVSSYLSTRFISFMEVDKREEAHPDQDHQLTEVIAPSMKEEKKQSIKDEEFQSELEHSK